MVCFPNDPMDVMLKCGPRCLLRTSLSAGLKDLPFEPGAGFRIGRGFDQLCYIVSGSRIRVKAKPPVVPCLIDAHRQVIQTDADENRRGRQPSESRIPL